MHDTSSAVPHCHLRSTASLWLKRRNSSHPGWPLFAVRGRRYERLILDIQCTLYKFTESSHLIVASRPSCCPCSSSSRSSSFHSSWRTGYGPRTASTSLPLLPTPLPLPLLPTPLPLLPTPTGMESAAVVVVSVPMCKESQIKQIRRSVLKTAITFNFGYIHVCSMYMYVHGRRARLTHSACRPDINMWKSRHYGRCCVPACGESSIVTCAALFTLENTRGSYFDSRKERVVTELHCVHTPRPLSTPRGEFTAVVYGVVV